MSGSQADADISMFTEGLREPAEEAKSTRTPKKEKAPTPTMTARSKIPDIGISLPEDDTDKKAAIMRKIASYTREFPEKLADVKVPKTFATKATLEEMKMVLADIEHELGKSGAVEIVRNGFISLCSAIEQFQEKTHTLPYNLTNFGKMAEFSASYVKQPDGRTKEGEMVPLLKEFSIKYGKNQ